MRVAIIQKQKIVQEIQTNLQNSKAVIFYNFHHIDNENLFLLRKKLQKVGGYWKVYKNTLIRRALQDKKDLALEQASALIFCQEDEYQPLKILNKFDQKYHKENKIKGGWYNEDYVPGATLMEWAKLPSKPELLQTFCYYLSYNLRRMVNLLEQLKNKNQSS